MSGRSSRLGTEGPVLQLPALSFPGPTIETLGTWRPRRKIDCKTEFSSIEDAYNSPPDENMEAPMRYASCARFGAVLPTQRIASRLLDIFSQNVLVLPYGRDWFGT